MPVSEAQLAANRANAKKSTGPKDCSNTRYNGIAHGLTALHALLPWENKADLDELVDVFEERFQPVDRYERLTIKHAAEAYWRKERSLRVESNIFHTAANSEYLKTDSKPGELHAGNLEAVTFMKAQNEFANYRRYDAHLQREYRQALAECEKMASLRRTQDQPPLPPPEPP